VTVPLPARAPRALLALVAVVALVLGACSDDDDGGSVTTSAASGTDGTTTSLGSDPALDALLIAADELPPGFVPSEDVDDTITAFCAGEDAAAGLQASGRALVGYTRQPAGASVIQLVFRFRPGDGVRFVDQATQILGRCSDVPDGTGLAFTYEPAPGLDAALAGTDAFVARHGTSAGSGSLAIDVAVFRHGDVAQLVAVLAIDAPRAELDALALTAVTAAATLPPGGP
jgi:hypothetical protein